MSRFPVRWKVTLGLHKTPDDYAKALREIDISVSNEAHRMLKTQVICSEEPITVCLAAATVAELGCPKQPSLDQVHSAILKNGGCLCPAEVGPALRLKHLPWLDVFADETRHYHLAMESTTMNGGYFILDHLSWRKPNGYYYPCLEAYNNSPFSYINNSMRFVFIVPE